MWWFKSRRRSWGCGEGRDYLVGTCTSTVWNVGVGVGYLDVGWRRFVFPTTLQGGLRPSHLPSSWRWTGRYLPTAVPDRRDIEQFIPFHCVFACLPHPACKIFLLSLWTTVFSSGLVRIVNVYGSELDGADDDDDDEQVLRRSG